jgi:DNA-binding IclR family transcriptional regulator
MCYHLSAAFVDPSISKGLFVIKSLASRGNSFEEISRRTGLPPEKVKRIMRKYIRRQGVCNER